MLIDGHPTQSFSCPMIYISECRAETINGKLYIVATKPKENQKAFAFDKNSRTNILSSLLVLYEKLSDDIYAHIENITEEDIIHICDWCVEYGMPTEAMGDDDIWMKDGKIGFVASDFCNRLHHLYTCYLLWRKIYLHDCDDSNYLVRSCVSEDECRAHLGTHMASLNIHLTPDFSVNPPTFVLTCPDLLEVAKAQMFFECMATDSYSVGVCSACGSPFPKKRKNNTLCEACQKTRYQRTREKQRMRKTESDKE